MATIRQRWDGRWPLGNSSSTNVTTGPMPIIHTQLETHRAKVASAPGEVSPRSNDSTYVTAAPPTA